MYLDDATMMDSLHAGSGSGSGSGGGGGGSGSTGSTGSIRYIIDCTGKKSNIGVL